MDEKVAIQLFIELRKQWNFYMQAGNTQKALEVFKKMTELGNKYPQIARLINTSRLGAAMGEAGFTASEAGTAVTLVEGAAEGGAIAETAVGVTTVTETAGSGLALGGAMTVGAAIAIAVVLGVAIFCLYQHYKKQNEHRQFFDFARKTVGNPNFKFKPFLGNVR